MTGADIGQDAAPDADASDDPRPPRPRRTTVPVGAFVVAVLVAVAMGALALLGSTGGDVAGNGDDTEIRLAAGRFAEQFLTFEHDGLDAWQEAILPLATSGFAEEVDDVRAGLEEIISQSELDATTTVSQVFVSDVERGSVDVVVIYDRRLSGPDAERTEQDRYLQLNLVRVDGNWLVDEVIDIASAGGLGDPSRTPRDPSGPTDTSPSTSAPG